MTKLTVAFRNFAYVPKMISRLTNTGKFPTVSTALELGKTQHFGEVLPEMSKVDRTINLLIAREYSSLVLSLVFVSYSTCVINVRYQVCMHSIIIMFFRSLILDRHNQCATEFHGIYLFAVAISGQSSLRIQIELNNLNLYNRSENYWRKFTLNSLISLIHKYMFSI